MAGLQTRKIGQNVTAFLFAGGTFVGDLSSFSVTGETKTQEGMAIGDTDEYPVPVGRAWTLEGELMCSGTPAFGGTVNSSSPTGTVTLTTGAGGYAGTCVVTNFTHKGEREGLQTYNITLKAQGPWTLS